MLCSLCISDCDESYVELLDSGGKSTTVYNVVAKYFEKEINNMTKVKSEFDTAQYAESLNLKSQVMCVNCWRRIDDFHKWQEEVVIQQEERLKQLQLPYRRDMVECVKLEMEMDVNNVDIFADSFADDICDNDEFLNEATEDPVAVCETQHECPPNNFLFVDQVMDDNCSNDSAYDDMPLLRRKKLAKSKTPVAVINQPTGADTLAAKRECRLCLQGGDKVRRKTRFYCTACMNPVCQQHSKVSYACFACLDDNCGNDSVYVDMPLLYRKKLAKSKTPVAVINQSIGADTLAAKRECRLCLQGGDKVRRKTRFYCTACMNPVCQQHSKVSYTCFACLPLNP